MRGLSVYKRQQHAAGFPFAAVQSDVGFMTDVASLDHLILQKNALGPFGTLIRTVSTREGEHNEQEVLSDPVQGNPTASVGTSSSRDGQSQRKFRLRETSFRAVDSDWKIEPLPTTFADGSCMITCGETVVLATVMVSAPRAGGKPFRWNDRSNGKVSVDYKEKYYAAGRIPPPFHKREVAMRENEMVISSRIQNMLQSTVVSSNDIELKISVLSADRAYDPEVVAANAASVALATAPHIPWYGPVGAVRVVFRGNECVPSMKMGLNGDSMLVACSKDGVLHVSGQSCQGVSPKQIVKGLEIARGVIDKSLLKYQMEYSGITRVDQDQHVCVARADPAAARRMYSDVLTRVQKFFNDSPVHIYDLSKYAEDHIKPSVKEKCSQEGRWRSEQARIPGTGCATAGDLEFSLGAAVEEMVTSHLSSKRCDGRKSKEILKGSFQLGSLPLSHGSSSYKAGHTMVMNAVTCASLQEQTHLQHTIHGSHSNRLSNLYSSNHHSRPEGRYGGPHFMREDMVHAAFIESAVTPSLPSEEDVPFSFRTNVDIINIDGSVLSTSLNGVSSALQNIGLSLQFPVVSSTVGLSCTYNHSPRRGETHMVDVDGETGSCMILNDPEKYVCVTDPTGLESLVLDAELVVGGSDKKASAWRFQTLRPTKVSIDMMKCLIDQSFEGQKDHKRNMAKILRGQKQKTRAKFGETSIPPSTLPKILADKGNVVQQIEETTGGKIYVRDDGVIKLFAPSIDQYVALEDAITSAAGSHLVPGRVYTAQVAMIKDFGAFVILPGSDIQALLHISEISPERIASVEDELSPGEEIKVKYLGRDSLGNLRVSKKQA